LGLSAPEEGRDAAWYAGMSARVEAKGALEQAEELWHVLEEWSWWRSF
jgi:hypothetical protein